MGDKKINLPDGRVVYFPSSMSDADIQTAIERDIMGKQSQPETLTSVLAAPGLRVQQAAEDFRRGNIAAGVFGGATAGLQTLALPFSLADYGLRQLPGGKGVSDVLALPFRAASGAVGLGEGVLKTLGMGKPHPEGSEFLQTIAPFGLPSFLIAAKRAGPGFSQRMAERAARTEAKAGSLLNIGNNIEEARRGGAFIFQEGIPGPGKIGFTKGKFGALEARSKGAMEARARVHALNEAFNEKIIDPATRAGELRDARPILESAKQIYEIAKSGALLPDRAVVRRMEWELKVLEERINERGGKLTPREIQDFKVKNNALLKEIYEKRSRGTLTDKQAAREAILLDNTAQMRKMIEDLDPQAPRINWSEGAGLQVAEAMDKFFEQRLGRDPALVRGTGINPAVGGKPRFIGLFTLTELATYTPFRVAYNRLLNKMYRGLGNVPREFVRPSEIRPYTPPPDATAGKPTIGLLPPFRPLTPVENIPNPSVGRMFPGIQQTVPESFVRGTGKEGLNIQDWKNATRATPEYTQYTGPYSEPPSYNLDAIRWKVQSGIPLTEVELKIFNDNK